MKSIILITLLLTSMACWASEPDLVADLLPDFFANSELGVHTDIPIDILTADPARTLAALDAYEQNESSSVRLLAFGLRYLTALHTQDITVRQDAVDGLVRSLDDRELSVRQSASEWLRVFRRTDFREPAVERILAVAQERLDGRLVLLVGVSGNEDAMDWLRLIAAERGVEESLGWCTRLALARLGSNEDAQSVVARIRGKGNEEGEKAVVIGKYIRQLAYVRHPLAIDQLVAYLDRDERSSPDMPGPTFASAAAGVLVEVFPQIQLRREQELGRLEFANWSADEIEVVRDWMRTNWRGDAAMIPK